MRKVRRTTATKQRLEATAAKRPRAARPGAVKGTAAMTAREIIDMKRYRACANRFRHLADATRLAVLYLLERETEMHVGAICQRLGQTQPAVSHHLALLRHGGIIIPRREGKNNFYGLTEDGAIMASIIPQILGRTRS